MTMHEVKLTAKPDADVKYCVDCKHHKRSYYADLLWCMHPSLERRNLVSKDIVSPLCVDARQHTRDGCGPDAALFERRQESSINKQPVVTPEETPEETPTHKLMIFCVWWLLLMPTLLGLVWLAVHFTRM